MQTGIMVVTRRWRHLQIEQTEPDPFEGVRPALRTLRASLTLRSDAMHYALRQGVTLAVAAETEHATGLPNGYWVPMTALLVLRPAFQPRFTGACCGWREPLSGRRWRRCWCASCVWTRSPWAR